MPKTPVPLIYQKLIRALRKELREGMILAEAAVKRQRVITYWNVGRHIHHYLSGIDGIIHNETIYLKRIARDMDFSLDVVRKMLKFFRCYPRLSQNPPLSWTQYRALLTAPENKRKILERRAFNESLGSDRLYAIIASGRKKERESVIDVKSRILGGNKLKQIRGRLFHYRTFQSNHLGLDKGEIMVDVGFGVKTKVTMDAESSLTGGNIVRSVKSDEGYELRYSAVQESQLYTYAAKVRKVVDGDTLHVTVDCGFDIWMDITIRLLGIDAPEKTTIAGSNAWRYVQERLVPKACVVTKTYKTEKYGRYLGDVYYLPKNDDPVLVSQEGIFLNQELLDKGLARLYGDTSPDVISRSWVGINKAL